MICLPPSPSSPAYGRGYASEGAQADTIAWWYSACRYRGRYQSPPWAAGGGRRRRQRSRAGEAWAASIHMGQPVCAESWKCKLVAYAVPSSVLARRRPCMKEQRLSGRCSPCGRGQEDDIQVGCRGVHGVVDIHGIPCDRVRILASSERRPVKRRWSVVSGRWSVISRQRMSPPQPVKAPRIDDGTCASGILWVCCCAGTGSWAISTVDSRKTVVALSSAFGNVATATATALVAATPLTLAAKGRCAGFWVLALDFWSVSVHEEAECCRRLTSFGITSSLQSLCPCVAHPYLLCES